MLVKFTTTEDNLIYGGKIVTQTLSPYDFCTEVGAEGWEQGVLSPCEEESGLDSVIEFAVNDLGWEVEVIKD